MHLITMTHTHGLLWTRDRPDEETSDIAQHAQQTGIHAPGGTLDPQFQQANSCRPTTLGNRKLDIVIFALGPLQTFFNKNAQYDEFSTVNIYAYDLFVLAPL
jgi:hypothetical protein